MVLCLGHKKGTDCYFRTKNPQNRINWEKWQLCIECARKLHPEFFKDIKNHGVQKGERKNKINKFAEGIYLLIGVLINSL